MNKIITKLILVEGNLNQNYTRLNHKIANLQKITVDLIQIRKTVKHNGTPLEGIKSLPAR